MLLSLPASVLPRIRPPAGRCRLPGKWEVCAGTDSTSAVSLGGPLIWAQFERSFLFSGTDRPACPGPLGRCTCACQGASGASRGRTGVNQNIFGRQLESFSFLFSFKGSIIGLKEDFLSFLFFFLFGKGKGPRKYGPVAERLLFVLSRIAQRLCPLQTSWRGVFLPFPPLLGELRQKSPTAEGRPA